MSEQQEPPRKIPRVVDVNADLRASRTQHRRGTRRFSDEEDRKILELALKCKEQLKLQQSNNQIRMTAWNGVVDGFVNAFPKYVKLDRDIVKARARQLLNSRRHVQAYQAVQEVEELKERLRVTELSSETELAALKNKLEEEQKKTVNSEGQLVLLLQKMKETERQYEVADQRSREKQKHIEELQAMHAAVNKKLANAETSDETESKKWRDEARKLWAELSAAQISKQELLSQKNDLLELYEHSRKEKEDAQLDIQGMNEQVIQLKLGIRDAEWRARQASMSAKEQWEAMNQELRMRADEIWDLKRKVFRLEAELAAQKEAVDIGQLVIEATSVDQYVDRTLKSLHLAHFESATLNLRVLYPVVDACRQLRAHGPEIELPIAMPPPNDPEEREWDKMVSDYQAFRNKLCHRGSEVLDLQQQLISSRDFIELCKYLTKECDKLCRYPDQVQLKSAINPIYLNSRRQRFMRDEK